MHVPRTPQTAADSTRTSTQGRERSACDSIVGKLTVTLSVVLAESFVLSFREGPWISARTVVRFDQHLHEALKDCDVSANADLMKSRADRCRGQRSSRNPH